MNNNILKIKFDASTIDGIIEKNMTYRPSMSDPNLYSGLQSILFVPTINLDRDMFGSELSDNDIKKNSIIKNINKIIKYHNINISIWDYIVSFFE